MNQTILSEQHFYKELVQRFFHPNSYFYHCIQSELDIVISQLYGPEKEHYLLLGNLMDKLVNAPNSYQELQDLGKISGFAEFNEKLVQGARYLYSAEIDTDRMKAEIEALAHSMFNSALLAFQDEESMAQMRSYLQLEEEIRPAWSEFEELPSEDPEEEMAEPNPEGLADFPEYDMPGEPDVFPRTGDDMEVVSEHESENDAEEGSSSELEPPNPVAAVTVEKEMKSPDREPGSLVAVFQEDLRNKLNELDALVAASYTEKAWKRALGQVVQVVDAIGISAMIHGFEAVEQLALKTKKKLRQLTQDDQATQALTIPLVLGLKKAGEILLRGNLEKVDIETVKSLTEEILKPQTPAPVLKETPFIQQKSRPEVEVPRQVETEPRQQPQAEDAPPRSVGENKIREEEPFSSQPSSVEAAVNMEREDSDFKLPGEDDQEILDLLAEVSGTKNPTHKPEIDFDGDVVADTERLQKTDEVVDDFLSLEYATNKDDSIETDPYQFSKSESASEVAIEKEPIVSITNVEEDNGGSPLSVYKRQARLYCSVIEDSLRDLSVDGTDSLALEDIELAANALHSLALKLDIETMARFPDVLLTISQNAMNAGYSFTAADQDVMTQVLETFRSLTSITAAESPPFTDLLSSLQALSERIAPNPGLKIDY